MTPRRSRYKVVTGLGVLSLVAGSGGCGSSQVKTTEVASPPPARTTTTAPKPQAPKSQTTVKKPSAVQPKTTTQLLEASATSERSGGFTSTKDHLRNVHVRGEWALAETGGVQPEAIIFRRTAGQWHVVSYGTTPFTNVPPAGVQALQGIAPWSASKESATDRQRGPRETEHEAEEAQERCEMEQRSRFLEQHSAGEAPEAQHYAERRCSSGREHREIVQGQREGKREQQRASEQEQRSLKRCKETGSC
jgi:hypothetical protein